MYIRIKSLSFLCAVIGLLVLPLLLSFAVPDARGQDGGNSRPPAPALPERIPQLERVPNVAPVPNLAPAPNSNLSPAPFEPSGLRSSNCPGGVCPPRGGLFGGGASGSCPGGACPPGGGASAGVFGGGFGQGGLGDLAMLSALGAVGGGLGGGGGGPAGTVGQALTMAGMLSGNQGLMLAGLITSMIGGFGGGLGGATPQRGTAEEQPPPFADAGPRGRRETPSQQRDEREDARFGDPQDPSGTGSAPGATCRSSVFIVDSEDDDRIMYPSNISLSRDDCFTVFNTSNVAHTVSVEREDGTSTGVTRRMNVEDIHNFRFSGEGSYTLCTQREDGTSMCELGITIE